MREEILTAEAVSKKYADTIALDQVSLSISRGECLAILGPNGAGKSTLCEILEGLAEKDQGNIRIFGLDADRERRQIQERVGIALQETSLYKKYTVKETLTLFASFFRRRVNVDGLIVRLGLIEKANTWIEKLSQGQKQRVYLGCALVNDPELLFLDEPTSGLDPQSRRMIWDYLLAFKNQRRGILLTTHFMDEAAYLADRIAIIDHGRIIAIGSAEELVRRHCPNEQLYFRCDHDNYQELVRHLAWLGSATLGPRGYRIDVEQPEAAILEIMQLVASANLKVNSFEVKQANLEDVFLLLTGRSIRNA